MTFTPRPGRCEICGKEMMVNSAVHKYCKECRNLMRNSKSKEFREKEIARRIAIRRGTDPEMEEWANMPLAESEGKE